MFLTISYDITDNRRRQRLAKVLSNFGYQVQKSVFELEIDAGQFVILKQKIEAMIDWENDSVRYYRLCGRYRSSIEISVGDCPGRRRCPSGLGPSSELAWRHR